MYITFIYMYITGASPTLVGSSHWYIGQYIIGTLYIGQYVIGTLVSTSFRNYSFSMFIL